MKNYSLFGLWNLGSQGKPAAHIPSASAFDLNTREKVSSQPNCARHTYFWWSENKQHARVYRDRGCWKLPARQNSTTLGLLYGYTQEREQNPVQTSDVRLEMPSGNRTIQHLHLYTIYNIWFKIKKSQEKYICFCYNSFPSPPPPMKSLLVKGIMFPPLSCFGLILRSQLGPGNMEGWQCLVFISHTHLFKDPKHLQSHLQIWETTIQWKPDS